MPRERIKEYRVEIEYITPEEAEARDPGSGAVRRAAMDKFWGDFWKYARQKVSERFN